MRLTARRTLCFGLIIASVAMVSCSRRSGPELIPTTGELFVGGQPAVGARLAFQPEGDVSADRWPLGFPRAIVDEAGKFIVETYEPGDGCPAGDYILLVTWPANVPGQESGEEAETVDRLQGRYASGQSSPLKAKVQANPTELGRYEIQ